MYIRGVFMNSKVFKLGNSNAIRLPKTIMEALNLQTNDLIKMTIVDKKLTIEKQESKKTIKQLFKDYEGKYEVNEILNDSAIGRELL